MESSQHNVTENALERHDDLYIVYPAHLRWLMTSHNLTIVEICAVLGLPSIQEWYTIQKDGTQPVKSATVVATARYYLRHPERLPVPSFSIPQIVQRAKRIIGDDAKAERLLEALFDRHWKTILTWYNKETDPDFSARRVFSLMGSMSDTELSQLLHDSALNGITQVYARPLHVYEETATGERRYASDEDLTPVPVDQMLSKAPKPGRRRNKNDYVRPSSPVTEFGELMSSVESSHPKTPDDPADDIVMAANEDSGALPWLSGATSTGTNTTSKARPAKNRGNS